MLGPPTPKPLLTGKVPIVVVGWHVEHPAVDVVRTSDEHGLALAVSHLVNLGHRRIAHIDGGNHLIATLAGTPTSRRCARTGWALRFAS